MPRSRTHAVAAAVTVGGALFHADEGKSLAKPAAGALLAAALSGLPDQLEPAVHPNHRQFFHGVAFATAVGIGTYKAYKWKPKDEWQQLVRFVLLVGGSAYLIHLVMDACTSRSLPLVGRL